MQLRNPLANAHGLGSAKDGVGHWWAQRISAIALALLVPWFLLALLGVDFSDHAVARAWLAQPINAVLMSALVLAALYHAQLGLQVVVEDYIHTRWVELSLLVLIRFATLLAIIASLLAVLRVFIRG